MGTHPTEDVFVSCEMCLAFPTAVYSMTRAKVDIVGKTHGENGGDDGHVSDCESSSCRQAEDLRVLETLESRPRQQC